MGEMYEVLRFIEHGSQCRQSMDYVQGTILIYYLRDSPQVEKSVLFGWFMQIGTSLDQYRRCRKGQPYRYLNPYSILVSEEGRLLLLDPDSPENDFILKRMQQRAVRAHFVKPALDAGRRGTGGDLFGFGRTVQFMLACTHVSPPLTRREEMCLMRFIDRCTVNEKKRYEDVRQALDELPVFSERRAAVKGKGRVIALGTAAVLLLCAVSCGIFMEEYRNGQAERAEAAEETAEARSEERAEATAEEPEMAREMPDFVSGEQGEERDPDGTDPAALPELVQETAAALDAALLENTSQGNQEVLLAGKELEQKTLRALAAAYEREEMAENAIRAYRRLIEVEDRSGMIEQAGIRKMELEAAAGMYAQAVLTGEEVLERVGESQTVTERIQQYRALESGEVQTDAAE